MSKKLLILLLIITALLTTACGKDKSADAAASSKVSIDIEKCISDTMSGIELEPDYTFVKDYTIKCDEDQLTISIVVDDSTSPELGLDFADTVVRQLNLYANMQDSSISLASADSYGGLYDAYDALVGVAPASKVSSINDYYVYSALTSSNSKLKLK